MKKISFITLMFSCFFVFMIFTPNAQAIIAPTGAECTANNKCDTSIDFCPTTTPRVCTTKIATGSTNCTTNNMCQSNYCNTTNSTCEVQQPPILPPSQPSGLTPTNASGTTTSLPNPLGTTSINLLLGRIIRYVVGLSGALALVIFIYGGLMWIFSQGKADMINKGKKAISYSVIGLVIIFTSYIIIRFIITALTKFT